MVTFDKTLPNQNLILTLSEKKPSEDNILVIELLNNQTNKTYSLTLPENTSNYKTRFDSFNIPTSSISTWNEGQYIYRVWEVNETNNTKIQELEKGLLMVQGEVINNYISISTTDVEDDYIVME